MPLVRIRTPAERLHRELGIRMEDVFVSLVEVTKENWSFGNGVAQYADKRRPGTAE